VIEPLLPNKPRDVPGVDDRRALNGIFRVLRSGAPWRDLPERYGPRTTCHNHFVRWRKAGVWDPPMDATTAAQNGDPDDRQRLRSCSPAGCDGKKGVQISVSVDHAAGSRPGSTSSMLKASRSGSA
jgi:transposase